MRRIILWLSPALRREIKHYIAMVCVLRNTNARLSSELARLEARTSLVESALRERGE